MTGGYVEFYKVKRLPLLSRRCAAAVLEPAISIYLQSCFQASAAQAHRPAMQSKVQEVDNNNSNDNQNAFQLMMKRRKFSARFHLYIQVMASTTSLQWG